MGYGDILKSLWRDFVDAQFDPEFLEKFQAMPSRENEYGYDSFGFNREDTKSALLLANLFYKYYFRAETKGIENVPSAGRVLLIANHSGQLPYDALVISSALAFDHDPPRMLRSMIERFIPTIPYVSYAFARWGQIIGTPENCRRLLDDDEAILVFPEGARGISKPFSKRYQLQSFGMGFMRLALATGTPIVPVAVIGAEEQAPAINIKPLAKLLGAPAFPLMPIPPFFPAVPLPTKYRLYFGKPMQFEGDPDLGEEELGPFIAKVRNTIQSMIHLGLKARDHVFW